MEHLIMRFYSSSLITSSLVFLLVGAVTAATLSTPPSATLTGSSTVQLLTHDSGQPSHRGSGRKEFFELSVLTQQIS